MAEPFAINVQDWAEAQLLTGQKTLLIQPVMACDVIEGAPSEPFKNDGIIQFRDGFPIGVHPFIVGDDFKVTTPSGTVLDVVLVGSQRLQDLSLAEILGLGFQCPCCGYMSLDAAIHCDHSICENREQAELMHPLKAKFAERWDTQASAGTKYEDNPWVWTVFVRLREEVDASA